MRAVAYKIPQPISAETSLIDVDLPIPEAKGHDLLVEIKAVSVNPVDTKVRKQSAPPADELKVLGWDAAGIVKAVGPDVTLFKAGDEVYLCRCDRPPGLERGISSRRRAHRRPQAEEPRFRSRRRTAADVDHRL